MELRELIKIIKKDLKILIIFVLVGTIAGLAVYMAPSKYEATGTLFIGRNTDVSFRYFTYEGYYGQQTALSYTTTIASLLNTTDVIKMALEKLGTPVNEYTLRQFNRDLSVKKLGPQLISITIKNYNQNTAKASWQALTTVIMDTSTTINNKNDPNLQIVKISEEPNVKPMYKVLWLFAVAGAALGLVIGIFILSLKTYINNGDQK